jgi:hypothetical protein
MAEICAKLVPGLLASGRRECSLDFTSDEVRQGAHVR